MSEWIYCKDKMPTADDKDLLFVVNPNIQAIIMGSWNGDDFVDYDDEIYWDVYAWMPLPDPPPVPEGT